MQVPAADYDLYPLPASAASAKVDALLAYKGVAVRRHDRNLLRHLAAVWRRTGRASFPVLSRAPVVVSDSTEIARYLEEHHPDPSLHDPDPRRAALGRLMEQLADEWIAPTVGLVRWTGRATARSDAARVAQALSPGTSWGARAIAPWVPWLARASLWQQGARKANRETLLGATRDLLEALEEILSESRFLLGGRPTLGDFGLYGALSLLRDGADGPLRISESLVRWLDAMEAIRAGKGVGALGRPPLPLGRYSRLLTIYARSWLRVAVACSEARRAGAWELDIQTDWGPYRTIPRGLTEGLLKDDLAAIEGAVTRGGDLIGGGEGEAPIWVELQRLASGPCRDLLRPYPALSTRLGA